MRERQQQDLPAVPLRQILRERMAEMARDPDEFPIQTRVEETEEVIRILWEFVGHMGEDVGVQGYEARLIERARHWATELQTAMLAAIARVGPRLLESVENEATRTGNE